ncbi:transcriptional regulator with XRE-family HTH domain [Amycolatopsis lexingtonensis]|uniref:Transcriptional regulator with XRE-family HTH domain n=1 Tax=Amycolatopsis lexingtonensis TaxID=218822 RepID=A0ABR9I4I2_9PSEU|nr:transcriptional regulator with XRE-family HTH domain [Amycolatopsis lexingtonensis]
MRRALAARDTGAVYRLLRGRGVSRRQIAMMTGQSQPEVAAILTGRQAVGGNAFAEIVGRLGIPYGHLGRVDADESAKRRRFLAHATQVTMAAAVFGPESGTWSAGRARTPAPARIGMTDVRQVEAATRALRELDYQYGGGFCRDAVASELSWAESLQQAEAAVPVQERLEAAVGNLRSLAEPPLVESHEPPAAAAERAARRQAAPASQWVIRRASRVLPVIDRERYCDEYLSELDDLAQAPHPRRAQLAYVLRLVVRVPLLRFALRGDGETRELAR